MTVRNAYRLMKKLRAMPASARAGIGTALAVSVLELDSSAKRSIQGGARSGRFYRRTKSGKSHQASAPGEFPKSDSGQLVASLFFRVAGDKLSAFFGTMLAYGKWLEFGTGRMAARPWLRPTFRAHEAGMKARIGAAVRDALRKFTGNAR